MRRVIGHAPGVFEQVRPVDDAADLRPGHEHLRVFEQAAGVGQFDGERVRRLDAVAETAEHDHHVPDDRQTEEHEQADAQFQRSVFRRHAANHGPGRAR